MKPALQGVGFAMYGCTLHLVINRRAETCGSHPRANAIWKRYPPLCHPVAVEKLLAYLVYGEFRKDYPRLAPGVVPPAAFQLEALRQALQSFDYEIK